jgi:hypothetical protein
MTPIEELSSCEQHTQDPNKSNPIGLPNSSYGHRQVGEAKEAVIAGAGRVQDRLAKVWTALLPVKREDMPNAQVWADLIAIKNRMVFYNPAGLRPNKMKASLSLMRDDHADALKEMICRLDADVRAAV